MKLSRTHRVLLGAGGVVAALGVLGFRFNLTASLPPGIYRISSAPALRGAIVNVCLPPEVAEFAKGRGYLGPGSCDSGVRPLGKLVLAMGGDVVTLRPEAIRVNGERVPRSATLRRDARGRALPHYPWGEHRLRSGQLWLFSPYRANAYDSRYFGPIPSERVVSVLKPVWTWTALSPWDPGRPSLAARYGGHSRPAAPPGGGGRDAGH